MASSSSRAIDSSSDKEITNRDLSELFLDHMTTIEFRLDNILKVLSNSRPVTGGGKSGASRKESKKGSDQKSNAPADAANVLEYFKRKYIIDPDFVRSNGFVPSDIHKREINEAERKNYKTDSDKRRAIAAALWKTMSKDTKNSVKSIFESERSKAGASRESGRHSPDDREDGGGSDRDQVSGDEPESRRDPGESDDGADPPVRSIRSRDADSRRESRDPDYGDRKARSEERSKERSEDRDSRRAADPPEKPVRSVERGESSSVKPRSARRYNEDSD